jgi:hypothetical protein
MTEPRVSVVDGWNGETRLASSMRASRPVAETETVSPSVELSVMRNQPRLIHSMVPPPMSTP